LVKQFIPQWLESSFRRLLDPIVKRFVEVNINPNWMTTAGFFLSIAAAYLCAVGYFVVAGALVLLSGIFDMIDGLVARASGRVTRFGALYDSTLDRYSEVIIFFGMGYYFIENQFYITSVATVFATGGSLMVSYIRARAEGLGFECKLGWMRRQERVVFVGGGAFLCFLHEYFARAFDFFVTALSNMPHPRYSPMPLSLVIFLVAFFSNATAVQRVYHIWKTSITRP
jgi:CDP-diacylglycerol--glycerol-3-phosphate 3-phosphatidyltransferase